MIVTKNSVTMHCMNWVRDQRSDSSALGVVFREGDSVSRCIAKRWCDVKV